MKRPVCRTGFQRIMTACLVLLVVFNAPRGSAQTRRPKCTPKIDVTYTEEALRTSARMRAACLTEGRSHLQLEVARCEVECPRENQRIPCGNETCSVSIRTTHPPIEHSRYDVESVYTFSSHNRRGGASSTMSFVCTSLLAFRHCA